MRLDRRGRHTGHRGGRGGRWRICCSAFDWRTALLLGTALSPTDPAVVFSVLGRREITGRTGALLEGESGANDPVGIALMAALLAAPATGWPPSATGRASSLAQMVVGAAVGVPAGWALLAFMRRVPLPSGACTRCGCCAARWRSTALATLAHGSGFLAVFVAGILVGDVRAPYKREIERFHSALASLAEIVAFIMLGPDRPAARRWPTSGAWLVGLALAVLLPS